MIGYYVHHVGRGHLHRAIALSRVLGDELTGLSSLDRPAAWPGDWVVLPRDDDGPTTDPLGRTARGRLHWAPRGHAGLRARAAAISSWVDRAAPRVLVVDVSVEVLLLARLHGVATVGVVLPGVRDDAAHALGLDVADALVGFWPAQAPAMLRGVTRETHRRLSAVGALSRFPPDLDPRGSATPGAPRRVLVMLGQGGHDVSAVDLARASEQTPGWTWDVLDGRPDTWVEDPRPLLAAADVVVTHAGQNALAETAAARRPAIVIPQQRPHDEQVTTGAVLTADRWPALVRKRWPTDGWPALLDGAAGLDASSWSQWCDGGAAVRFASVVGDVASTVPR